MSALARIRQRPELTEAGTDLTDGARQTAPHRYPAHQGTLIDSATPI